MILITRYVIPKQRAKHKHENTNMTPLISVRLEEMRSNQLRYFQHPNFVSSIKYTLQLHVTLNLPLVWWVLHLNYKCNQQRTNFKNQTAGYTHAKSINIVYMFNQQQSHNRVAHLLGISHEYYGKITYQKVFSLLCNPCTKKSMIGMSAQRTFQLTYQKKKNIWISHRLSFKESPFPINKLVE